MTIRFWYGPHGTFNWTTWLFAAILLAATSANWTNVTIADEVDRIPPVDPLLDWIHFAKERSWTLVGAGKANDYLIAVFETDEGDIAFCSHRKSLESPVSSSTSLLIADLNGNDLHADNEDLEVTQYQVKMTTRNGSATGIIPIGVVYPIRANFRGQAKIVFCASSPDNEKDLLIYEGVIDISGRP